MVWVAVELNCFSLSMWFPRILKAVDITNTRLYNLLCQVVCFSDIPI